MRKMPSWNWLATPLAQGSAPDSRRAARPCLPRIEQLDDRILLDATPASDDGGGNSALIGLLSKAATLSAAEFSAIGSLQGSSLDTKQKVLVSQLGDTFVKVDEILAKFG